MIICTKAISTHTICWRIYLHTMSTVVVSALDLQIHVEATHDIPVICYSCSSRGTSRLSDSRIWFKPYKSRSDSWVSTIIVPNIVKRIFSIIYFISCTNDTCICLNTKWFNIFGVLLADTYLLRSNESNCRYKQLLYVSKQQ